MFDLPPVWTRMPPDELTRLGQPRSSIHRTMSSMWMHMSPTIPLPYSLNVRHQRRCGSGALPRSLYGGASYGRRGAAPLGDDLGHPLVLAGGRDHRVAFYDIDADRLLHPDVGPGLAGGDHGQG